MLSHIFDPEYFLQCWTATGAWIIKRRGTQWGLSQVKNPSHPITILCLKWFHMNSRDKGKTLIIQMMSIEFDSDPDFSP